MASRRCRSRRSSSVAITDKHIYDLILKLEAVLPQAARSRISCDRVLAAAVIQETCSYIKKVRRKMDGLSERLSKLLATADRPDAQAAVNC